MAKTKVVRIDKKTVDTVEKHVKKTKQSIGGFFELAAKEKLTTETKKS